MDSGGGGAAQASALNSDLMRRFGEAGRPAIAGALSYAQGSLDKPLGDYITNAYQGQRVSAVENNRRQMAQTIGESGAQLGSGSGAGISSLSSIALSGGQALNSAKTSINTTQAVAGLEQRNKLLGVMSGGGATATNLGAGFGGLQNQSLGLSMQPNQAVGLGLGGLAAGLAAYGQYKSSQGSSLGSTPQGGDLSGWGG